MLWSTLVCCLVLAGTVSAGAWEPWRHYKYLVDIESRTALPDVEPIYTGVNLQLVFEFETVTATEFYGTISSAKHSPINSVALLNGWNREIPQEDLDISHKTFHVVWNPDGAIKQIHFEENVGKDEKKWITNTLQQCIIDPEAFSSKKQTFVNPAVSRDSSSAIYKAYEKSILGECEVLYYINPLTSVEALLQNSPLDGDLKNYRVVHKSWNFTNCKRRNEFKMGLSDPQNFEAGGNAQLPTSRSYQTTITIEGDPKNYTITNVETNSTMRVPPQLHNKQTSMVVTNFKAQLVEKTPLASPPERPSYLIKEKRSASVQQPKVYQSYMKDYTDMPMDQENPLKYSHFRRNLASDQAHAWPENIPLPFHKGFGGKRIGDASGRNISFLLVTLAEEIAEQLHSHAQLSTPTILSQVIVGVKHMRTMFVEEILAAHAIIRQRERETGNLLPGKVLRNIAALTGTPHSLQAMLAWLVKDEVSPEEFIYHFSLQREVALLPDAYYLETVRQIALLVDGLKKPYQETLKWLRATVALTFTDLLRLAGRKHKQLTQTAVDYYMAQLEEGLNSGNSEQQQLAIRLLGNIGSKHPKILKTFYEIINGAKNVTEHVRLHALVSLDWVATYHPNSMNKYFFSVFANTSMPCRLRCQAVPNIMRSNPPAWMLQQMAEATHNESNPQVRAQVSSAIQSAAKLRGRYNEQLARNARAAVSLLKQEEFDASYSSVIFDSYKIEGMDLAYTQLFSYIGSQDSLLPSAFQYSVYKNFNGYRPLTLQASGMVTSANDTLEAIMQALLQAYEDTPAESQEETYETDSVFHTFLRTEPTPFKKMHVQRRPKLLGYINIPGYVSQPFDGNSLQHTIKDFFWKFDGSERKMEIMKISNGGEVMCVVPDGIAFDHVYTYTTMFINNITGSFRAQKHVTESSKLILKAVGSIDVTYAMRKESRIGFITPYDSMDYMSGLDENIQVHIPKTGSIQMEISKNLDHVKVSADFTLPKDRTNIFHHSTVPYVTKLWLLGKATTNAANPNTTILHTKPPLRVDYTLGKNSTGMAMRVDYYSEIDDLYSNYIGQKCQNVKGQSWWSSIYSWLYRLVKPHNAFSLIHFPFASRDIHLNSLNVTYEPQESTAEGAQFSFEIGVPETGVRQVQANATFVGEKVAAFGVQGALHTNMITPSFNSTVNVWSQPAVDEPLNAAVDVSLQVPVVDFINFHQALSASPNSTFKASATISRPSWPKPAVISLAGDFGRTPQREEYIRESPEGVACQKQIECEQQTLPICQEVASWANSLDAYKIKVYYKNIPVELKRITYSVYAGIRQALYPQIQEDAFHVNPSINSILLDLYINNQSTAYNVSIQSSLLNANATCNPLPSWARPLIVNAGTGLPGRVIQQIYPESYSPSCVVGNTTIVTFDGKSYPGVQSNCWYIALADTPKWRADAPVGETPVYEYKDLRNVVIFRRTKNGVLESKFRSQTAVIELLGQQHTPTPKIIVNGEQMQINKEEPIAIDTLAVIYLLPYGGVVVRLYGSQINEIYQDSQRMEMTIHHSMKESVRGMCGDFDGNCQNDFQTPEGCVTNDFEAFQAQWADCELPQKEYKCVGGRHNAEKPQPPEHPKFPISSCSSESSESEEETPMDLPLLGSFLPNLPEIGGHISPPGLGGHLSASGAGLQFSPPGLEVHLGNHHPSLIHKFDVQHFGDVSCFSTNPIPKCRDGLTPEEGVVINVDYNCVPKGPLAQMYEENIQHIKNTRFMEIKTTRQMMLLVPAKCKNP